MPPTTVDIPQKAVADFCRRHHIRKLALFGSVLRSDFRADSDIDVCVRGVCQGVCVRVSEP
jgi:predicted nucleotidyltransferase